MNSDNDQLFARFFVEENQSECSRLLEEIGQRPFTERTVRSLSSKLMSSTNPNIRKKIVHFLGERIGRSAYTGEILNVLRDVVECDESAPVRSAAIEYLQASEQKRSFSSLPSLLINRKLPTESRLTVENGAGYESDSMLKRTSSPPVVLATTAAASSSLAPPAKKMGKLASLMSKVEHDNKVKKERDDRETSLMNAALMRQQKAREEAERATADAEAESKRNAEKKKKELIDLTEELKYKGDDDNGSSSISSNGALSSLWSGSSNGNGIKRKLPKSFGTTTTATTTTTQLSSSLPPQKSFSLPFMMEKTIHTKRANQHPILGGSTGGFLRGSLLHGSPVMQANTMKNDSLSRKLPSRVVPDRTPLSAEQRAILSLAETKRSFFFTGAAGTGKSFVLRRVVLAMKELYGDENVFVTASTGIAACNIGGVTLHSFAGIGVGQKTAKELVSSILKLPQPRKRWHKAKCLIVDEVSMICGELFDKLEEVARIIRKNHAPFGGIQVILCGDFFQLPPVFSEGEKKYCFEAVSWNKVISKCVELKTVFRQKDQSFVQLLNEVRTGHISKASWDKLQECCTRELPHDGIEPTRLYPFRETVEKENQRKLIELPSACEQVFRAVDRYDNEGLKKLLENLPAPAVLTLRIGAQVILLKNLDSKNELVNGAQGVVVAFELGSDKAIYPVVRFKNGVVAQIERDSWEIESGGRVVAARTQVPLGLAWAISIHKSQGMTLSRVVMRLENVFSEGQAYVALSRVKSIDGLKIDGKLPREAQLKPSQRVLDFYSSMSYACCCSSSSSSSAATVTTLV